MSADRTVLVTGGLGFIGSAFVRMLVRDTAYEVVNLDKVTYASTAGSVESAIASPRYRFHRCDLADDATTAALVARIQPDFIVHLAAETHVDRSIDGPRAFIDSNIIGTFNLLQAARSVPNLQRFVHVSTDEVFGSLEPDGQAFDEHTAYDPRSPYSASKAAADHLVRAWGETYSLPVSVTNCSNNYGPYQFPEKLIPLMIIKALRGEKLPVYGQGLNVRDWLHVDDHAAALRAVMERGESGVSYAIGGGNELSNLDVVRTIADLVQDLVGDADGIDRSDLIQFVMDRPGHDLRYAVDATFIGSRLGWEPTRDFADGLAETVSWYRANEDWWAPLMDRTDDGARIGLGGRSEARTIQAMTRPEQEATR